MVRAFMVLTLALCGQEAASAQVLNIDSREPTPGNLQVEGSIELPKGWTIANPTVKVFAIRPAGGIDASTADGSTNAAGTAWNNGKTPAGPVVLSDLVKGSFAVYATVSVKDPKGKVHTLTSTVRYLNVP